MLWGGADAYAANMSAVGGMHWLSSVSVLCLAVLLFNLLRKWGFMFTS
jgi:hypothetical protein